MSKAGELWASYDRSIPVEQRRIRLIKDLAARKIAELKEDIKNAQGAGDLVAAGTKAVGIPQGRCGRCGQRQQALNQRFPFGRRHG